MRQPDLHPSEHLQQETDSFPDLVTSVAQPRITRRDPALLRLRERLARLLQDVLLVAASRRFEQQIYYSLQLRPREPFALDHRKHFFLVALWQPYNLPRSG